MGDPQQRANDLIAAANELHNAGDQLRAAPMYVEAAGLFAPYASFALVAGDSFAAAGDDAEAVHAYRLVLVEEPDHDQAKAALRAAEKRLKKRAKRTPIESSSPISKSGFFGRRTSP